MALLDDFADGLAAVREAEGLDGVLRWTGEQLAAASDRLAKARKDECKPRAAELLVIAWPHVQALAAASMPADALATQNMAMLTVLQAKVSPESFASLWLQSLQGLCLMAAGFIEQADGRVSSIAADIAAHSYGLFIATAHSYIPRFGCSDEMRRFYDHMRHMAAVAGEDVSHFQGHRIVPTLAIDIFADNAARLAAIGV